MENKILEAAFGGLLHDIGKFWQRAYKKNDLDESELALTPISKAGNYHTHLHSGYTSRFFRQYLKMFDSFEKDVSAHHLGKDGQLSDWIITADRMASSIDRSDEHSDYEQKNSRGRFRCVRLHSVFSEVDFGKQKNKAVFQLNPLSQSEFPNTNTDMADLSHSVQEYQDLFNAFTQELTRSVPAVNRIDAYSYDRMYALLYEYAALVPASTYESTETFVSLFDHLKLTSAIASCLAASGKKTFRMLEFDISGIQKFIFQITEGDATKKGIARALRGRSLLVSLITDAVMYAYLHEFGMTQANIIFQTGGGAMLLLPNTDDFEERTQKVLASMQAALFERFGTDITFVAASVELDAEELEYFKIGKAIELKDQLEAQKAHKFSTILNDGFFKQEAGGSHVCEMCGQNFTEQKICETCDTIQKLSDFYIKNQRLFLAFSFDPEQEFPRTSPHFTIGNVQVIMTDFNGLKSMIPYPAYVESINQCYLGITRYLANLAPMKDGHLLPFDEIAKLPGDEYGDPKLGILKMDVDNLGAVFAYGMDAKTRSLSKYLTLSRLMELFFGRQLPEICQSVSRDMNMPDLNYKVDNETIFYINYAGGDDLAIIGPAAGIVRLAEAIDKQFRQYTQNDNITISGGIFIQKPKEPLRFGIRRAEEYLSKSKENPEKNCITLIDTVCTFKEYGDVLKAANEHIRNIDDGLISRSNFYHLMQMMDTEDYYTFCRHVPIILYNLKRNVKDVSYLNRWRRNISKYNSKEIFDTEMKKSVLAMKLAIMQTREGK